ncbi:MAG TPA: glycosyltransferase family 39 protein [Candidatus Omnitrophota bacterium]|nr:glycosyltransferase family 39 protein [Candidatus Omnitrophota bacterium]HPT07810.1 glycosyltransferase family 39 protein [Candidatus Omnitrophota bacterium]
MTYNLQKWQRVAILLVILVIGFLLRTFNLDFPSIGYHNMKENEYLSMAQEMNRSGDYTSRKIYFYFSFDKDPRVKWYPQVPLVSYQTVLAWKALGENLWAPRLVNVVFGLFSILTMYLIAQLLFKNAIVSLFASLMMALMPLAIFFSRNLQPESPGFFFMLLGTLFYLRFAATVKKQNLLWAGLAFSIAWTYKFSFIFGMLPVLFYLPYTRLFSNRKDLIRMIIVFTAGFALALGVYLWLQWLGQWEFEKSETFNRIKIFAIFHPSYWKQYGKMISWYVCNENFTWVYTILTAVGIIRAFFYRRGLLDRFIIGWSCTLIIYCMIFSDHINQHNYYQMPFLALVCVASVYAVLWGRDVLQKFFKRDFTVILLSVVIAGSAPFVADATVRMYSSIFPGCDVAGESLKEFTKPNDRVFLYTYPQGVGIARYARRFMDKPASFADFKKFEQEYDIRYACFYPAEFVFTLQKNDPALFTYIQSTYHVKEVGLTGEPNKVTYIILERGKGSDPKNFLQSFSGKFQLRTIYRVLGRYVFFYTLRPPVE